MCISILQSIIIEKSNGVTNKNIESRDSVYVHEIDKWRNLNLKRLTTTVTRTEALTNVVKTKRTTSSTTKRVFSTN